MLTYDSATGFPVELCPGVWHMKPRRRFPWWMLVAFVATTASLAIAGCASSGLGPRTAPGRGVVEIRMENHNWSSARVYVVTNSGRPRRVALVTTERTVIKNVRIHSYNFTFLVDLLAGRNTWIGFNTWSTDERCLHIIILNALNHTYVVPCRAR